ncbi:MAG TPA: GEVED domain-containing protein, partial [Flavobacteriales bacterium]
MDFTTLRTFLAAALLPSLLQAQVACPSHELTERALAAQGRSTDLRQAVAPNSGGLSRESTLSIPVVVHLVWNTPEENLDDATVRGIIDRLNQDLTGLNADLDFVREVFRPVIGDPGVELCLALRTPSGQPTTGITRRETNVTWFDPDNNADGMKTAASGTEAWAPDRYLNIWVCDITSGSPPGGLYNGYAYLPAPGVVGAWFDGMVLDASLATQPNSHTGTHELGHYLGLFHPWGGGGCNSTDDVHDTPATDGPTLNCTNNALMKCDELTQYENFMDYSACKCMFTQGQSVRMSDVLTGIRQSLLESNGCEAFPPPLSYCVPAPENGTFDDDLIDGVVLGAIVNTGTGDTLGPSYTDYTAEFSTELAQGATAFISITGGGYWPDNYAAWIDYNKDTLFTDDERLVQFMTSESGQTVTSGFVVPLDASLGETRMRVRCVYQGEETTPVDPCADYGYGETEDYTVVILAGEASVCIPTSGSGTSDGDFIDGVVLGDIQNTGTGGVGAPSYTDYSATFSTELEVGAAATLTLTSGTYEPDHFSAWIDYDQDLLFEPEENLGHFTTSAAGQTFDLDLFVPLNAVPGTTRLRVRGVYHGGGEPSPTDPCYPYNWGETEDYT